MLLDVQFRRTRGARCTCRRTSCGGSGAARCTAPPSAPGAALLELAHGRHAFFASAREELLGDLELAHVVAADLGDDVRFFVAVVGLEGGHGGTRAGGDRASAPRCNACAQKRV